MESEGPRDVEGYMILMPGCGARQGRRLLEDEYFNSRLAALCRKFEAAHPFTNREFVGLVDDGDRMGRIRQPHASELNVTGDGYGATAIASIRRCGCSPEYPLISVSPAPRGISRT